MFTLNCKGRLLVIDKPLVMGIINATPDSFFDGSRFNGVDEIVTEAERMLNDGADVIDLGGQSTRPGSDLIPADEEIKRVIPAIKTIANKFPGTIISIDTFYSKVAAAAIGAGATIVNDISAGSMDHKMIGTVAELKVPYVLMHMKGTPQTMQQNSTYENVTRDVLDFFIAKTRELKNAGIIDIIIDPGFGFAKTIDQNFELLKDLSVFKMLDKAIMLGISRKSTVYKTLGVSADEALNGTSVLNTIGLMNGASILRVHDVKEAREAVKLFSAIYK
ncbi:MAG TPA: dihydropteroate synthase [Chitinophagaceae bacterium]|jgi:dihydropteroate synthase|nr:dihydropteroate synthase [Chitinophagaceae bacterium]